MEGFSRWDIVLLAAVGYVAIAALVRLMDWRRRQLEAELRRRTPAPRADEVDDPV
jgi:hypothetical protein